MHTRVSERDAYGRSSLLLRDLRDSNRDFAGRPDPIRYLSEQDHPWRALPPDSTNRLTRRLAENPLSRDLQTMIATLQRENGYPVFGEVFLTNRYGANVAQSGRTTD